jgi:hypothetical protein
MANERIPNDLTRSNPADDPYRTPNDPYRARRSEEELTNAARPDNDLQMDSELTKGPASSGRIAVFAIAIAVALGAVFYGLNNSTTNPAGTSTAQNTPSSPPAAPPGMRDVTPRANNTAPGQTTGAAPAQPQTPPSAAPAGPDVNRTANPPLDNGQSK